MKTHTTTNDNVTIVEGVNYNTKETYYKVCVNGRAISPDLKTKLVAESRAEEYAEILRIMKES